MEEEFFAYTRANRIEGSDIASANQAALPEDMQQEWRPVTEAQIAAVAAEHGKRVMKEMVSHLM